MRPRGQGAGPSLSAMRMLELGGSVAGALLVALGLTVGALGIDAWDDVRDRLAEQRITAPADAPEITGGALDAGEAIDTGEEASRFADIVESHALEATDGRRYGELGRFLTEGGAETDDEAEAARTPDGRPVVNPLRTALVTETALASALNAAAAAETLALVTIIAGIALLLAGISFVVLVRVSLRAWAEAAPRI